MAGKKRKRDATVPELEDDAEEKSPTKKRKQNDEWSLQKLVSLLEDSNSLTAGKNFRGHM